MVTCTCERSGLQFEAKTRQATTHPQIRAWLDDAYKNNWLHDAEETIRNGNTQGWTTINQFIAALRETEQRATASCKAHVAEENKRKRDMEEAKRQRHITNSLLRGRGYIWRKFEYDEEDQDFFKAPAYEWTLYSPDGRIVSVKEAMLELAYQNVKFAKEWLASRNIPEEAPEIEKQRQAEQAEKEAQQKEIEQMSEEDQAYHRQFIAALLEAGLSQEKAEKEAIRLSKPHSPIEDSVIIGIAFLLPDGREVKPVINGDMRYGLLEDWHWIGIDEVLVDFPDIPQQSVLREYSAMNKRNS